MKINRISEIQNMFNASLMLIILSIGAIYISFAAVDFVQEKGTVTSMLGYNRDWLVAAMPYFIASLVVSALAFIFTLYKLKHCIYRLRK